MLNSKTRSNLNIHQQGTSYIKDALPMLSGRSALSPLLVSMERDFFQACWWPLSCPSVTLPLGRWHNLSEWQILASLTFSFQRLLGYTHRFRIHKPAWLVKPQPLAWLLSAIKLLCIIHLFHSQIVQNPMSGGQGKRDTIYWTLSKQQRIQWKLCSHYVFKKEVKPYVPTII